eukprot:jgi/Picre1/28397/NNA_003802.t1
MMKQRPRGCYRTRQLSSKHEEPQEELRGRQLHSSHCSRVDSWVFNLWDHSGLVSRIGMGGVDGGYMSDFIPRL